MKTLKVASSAIDAQMTAEYLRANEVDALVNGSREYASIVTGSDYGRFEILVPEEQFSHAKELLRRIEEPKENSKEKSHLVPVGNPKIGNSKIGASDIGSLKIEDSEKVELSKIPLGKKSLLKRAIVYAFTGAIILPVLFNIVSFYYLIKYLKAESNLGAKTVWTVLVLLVNSLSIFYIYFALNS